jgi:hypothetical protein
MVSDGMAKTEKTKTAENHLLLRAIVGVEEVLADGLDGRDGLPGGVSSEGCYREERSAKSRGDGGPHVGGARRNADYTGPADEMM